MTPPGPRSLHRAHPCWPPTPIGSTSSAPTTPGRKKDGCHQPHTDFKPLPDGPGRWRAPSRTVAPSSRSSRPSTKTPGGRHGGAPGSMRCTPGPPPPDADKPSWLQKERAGSSFEQRYQAGACASSAAEQEKGMKPLQPAEIASRKIVSDPAHRHRAHATMPFSGVMASNALERGRAPEAPTSRSRSSCAAIPRRRTPSSTNCDRTSAAAASTTTSSATATRSASSGAVFILERGPEARRRGDHARQTAAPT